MSTPNPTRHPFATRLMSKYLVAALVPVLLLTTIPLFSQPTPNPQFRETAVIPFFHKKNRGVGHFQTIYKRGLNGTDTLLVVRAGRWPIKTPAWSRGEGLIGLFVMRTDDPDLVWELAILDGYSDFIVEVEQADDKSIVLRIENVEGTVYRNQLLFDLDSRRLLKQFDPASKAVLPFLNQRSAGLVNFRTAYRKDLGDDHTLLLVLAASTDMMSMRDWRFSPPSEHFRGEDTFWQLGLFLVRAGNPDLAWELAVRNFNSAGSGKVERADDRSIVLHFEGEKEAPYKQKFIFDVPSKRLLKLWDVPLPVRDLLTCNGQLYAVVAHPEQTAVVRLDKGKPIQVTGVERDSVLVRAEQKPLIDGRSSLPFGSQGQFKLRRGTYSGTVIEERIGDEIKLYELPKSTFEELARYRPAEARPHERYHSDRSSLPIDDEDDIFEGEGIGPYQIVEDRLWFGKSFYDGEGRTGIGGFGYFDSEAKRYVLFSPPEIIPWSVSALFVGKRNIWLGLVYHGEWGSSAAGLLRFHRSMGRTTKFDLGESYSYQIIGQIKSKSRRFETYLATNAGLFVESGDGLTRYFFEPMLDGGVDIVKNPP